MAWSWSYTAEGMANIQRNIERLPTDDLRIVFAEWEACKQWDRSITDFDKSRYDAALGDAGALTNDVLAAEVYARSEGLAMCENGAFKAWICPFGCHTVTPDAPTDAGAAE